jgi:hypothetical protein
MFLVVERTVIEGCGIHQRLCGGRYVEYSNKCVAYREGVKRVTNVSESI